MCWFKPKPKPPIIPTMDLTGYTLVFSDEFNTPQTFPNEKFDYKEWYGKPNEPFIKDGITWKAEMVKYKQD